MSIDFIQKNQKLILILNLNDDFEYYLDLLAKDKLYIKKCFKLKEKNLYCKDKEDNKLYFCIGTVKGEYIRLDKDVFQINNDFYFESGIELQKRYFVANRNISIISKVDKIVNEDVYIGGDKDKHGYIPVEIFKLLIKKFPTTTELDKYAEHRISSIIKEYFPIVEEYEKDYNT